MKTYTYEGREYVESGEERVPIVGDRWLNIGGAVSEHPCQLDKKVKNGIRKILIPKEKSMEPKEDEYTIPVLVKASPNWAANVAALVGKVILCRKKDDTLYGPKMEAGKGDYPLYCRDPDLVAWPTQAQVEEEEAKLKPKADPLPLPVRQALDEAGLGCRAEGVKKLIEAMYAHPPKVQA